MFEDLNDENIQLYAAKAYQKPSAIMSEFEDDLQKFIYLKRLLTKYHTTGVLKDRLILNHIIVLSNVFGVEATTRMLFFKLDEKDLEVVKVFLIFLRYLPDVVLGINGKNVKTADIRLDEKAIIAVKSIK